MLCGTLITVAASCNHWVRIIQSRATSLKFDDASPCLILSGLAAHGHLGEIVCAHEVEFEWVLSPCVAIASESDHVCRSWWYP